MNHLYLKLCLMNDTLNKGGKDGEMGEKRTGKGVRRGPRGERKRTETREGEKGGKKRAREGKARGGERPGKEGKGEQETHRQGEERPGRKRGEREAGGGGTRFSRRGSLNDFTRTKVANKLILHTKI